MEIPQPYRAVVGRLFPDVAPQDLDVRRGQFHHVVVGPDRVVCLPRTEAAAARLPRRAALLRVRGGIGLGFDTPRPLCEGGGPGTDEPPFLVLRRVPGSPLPARALDEPAVADTAAACYATLLTGLARAADGERLRTVLPPAPRDRWVRFGVDIRTELFELMSGAGRLRAERELTAAGALPPLRDAVVHGDLGAENVLWVCGDRLPRLGGVVDWDEVSVGDPACDLAAVRASYGGDFLDRVLALGGWSDDATAARIAAIHGTFALQQALSGHRDGDEDALADGLSGYR